MNNLVELEVRRQMCGLFTNIVATEGKMFICLKSTYDIPTVFYQLKCVERIFLCLYYGPVPPELEHNLRRRGMEDDADFNLHDCSKFIHQLALFRAVRACRDNDSRVPLSSDPVMAGAQEDETRGTVFHEFSWRIRCRGSWRKSNSEKLANALQRATIAACEPAGETTNGAILKHHEVVLHISDVGAFVGLPLTQRTLSLRASALRLRASPVTGDVDDAGLARGGAPGSGGVRSTVAYGMCLRAETAVAAARSEGGDGRCMCGDVALDPVCGRGGVVLEAMRAWPATLILASDISLGRLDEARKSVQHAESDGAACAIVDFIACDAARLPLRRGWVTCVLADLPFGVQHAVFHSRDSGTPDEGHPPADGGEVMAGAPKAGAVGGNDRLGGAGRSMVRAVLSEALRVTVDRAAVCLLTAHESDVRATALETAAWNVVARDEVQLGKMQGVAMLTLIRSHSCSS